MNRGGVLVHLLCAGLAAALAFTWVRLARSGGTSEQRPREPVHEVRECVPGLEGEGHLGEVVLSVRVARRHEEACRAELEARGLRARLGLADGEPFQCLLELSRVATASGIEIDLAGLRVEDARGVALVPLSRPRAAGSGDVLDPLAVLAAPPDRPLREGEAVAFLLWGRAPESDARLCGAAGTSIALRRAPVLARDLASLARIDAHERADGAAPK